MSFSPLDISYFLQVVRHGHVGQAAQAVGISQPAVSKAIRRLESAVGVPIFERGAKGVRLTSSGRLFLESARRFDAQHVEMMRSASELRAHHSGLLRVGLTNPTSNSPAVQVLAELLRNRPGMRISIILGKSDSLNDAVENGDLDVAVVPSYPNISFSCAQLNLSEDTACVAARVDHPLFKRPSLTIHDLSDYAWVMSTRQSASRLLISQVFERADAPSPRVAVEVEVISEVAMGLLCETDLLALVPAYILRAWFGRIDVLSLPMFDVHRTIVLLTRPQATWSPLMIAFRDALLSYRRPREVNRPGF